MGIETIIAAATLAIAAGTGTYSAVEASKGGKGLGDEQKRLAEARRRAMEEQQARKGRAASILTGGRGLAGEPSLGRHSLLGGP